MGAAHRGVASGHRSPPDAAAHRAAREEGAPARDVYCFFDNTDVKLRAPFDARRLMNKLTSRTAPRERHFNGLGPLQPSGRVDLRAQLGA